MDSRRFDALTRALAAAGSRRGLVGLLTALPVAGGLVALLDADEVDAKGRRKRRKKRHKHGKGRRRKHHKGQHKKRKKKSKCAGDVCASGCPYTSIQEAIDDPAGPTTIRLCAETYGGTITIAKDLTLIGAGDGEDGTILDGQDAGTVVTVSTGTVALRELRITGGNARDVGSGGIDNGGTLEVTDCTISGNTGTGMGVGGIANSGDATLNSCTVSGNSGASGGILNFSLSTLTLSNCTISGNTAVNGGGIANAGDATLNSCTVTRNMAGVDGGGIFNGGTVTLNDSSVTDNTPNDCVNAAGGTGCR